LGIVGLGAYLYLCSVVWRRVCVDDFCKFLLLSTAGFGLIITQMEEPGHMLTVACLLGLRWHERHGERQTQNDRRIIKFIHSILNPNVRGTESEDDFENTGKPSPDKPSPDKPSPDKA
jgi:hypothetical protein